MADDFARAFADHIHFKPNRFHPLVWINGEPEVGKNVYIGGMSEVNANGARVVIGDNCDIASFVSINAADSHRKAIGLSDSVDRRDITLEESVFVGSHVVIKGGAHIGHHSVVAAGTIVEGRKIPPYSLVIGNPMTVKEGYYLNEAAPSGPLSHNRPTLGHEEEKATAHVLRSGWVAQGPEVKAFEDELCAFIGLPPGHAVALSSGTAALHVAMHVLGARDQAVAMPAYACSALLHAARLAGAKPVLVDNPTGSPNVSAAEVQKSGAKLAVVPHTYGIPAELSGLGGVRVIEDCAQALGARVGTHGDVGIFSFSATKLITSGGQGGMLVSKDKALADAARDYREFDQRHDDKPRFNFHLTDLQAAIGRVQLRRLPAFLERRAAIFETYRKAGLSLLEGPGQVHYRAVVRSQSPARIISALEAIAVRAIVPLEDWELLGEGARFPNALALCASTVSLPIYPSLAQTDVERIAKAAAA